ncbi:MAG: transglutaminase-like domain-containing protein [Prolixibacteraceae bacterium]|nr:transglutaminase-like domain-containing protein [Prolixibacteraceae bacterium]
MQNSRLNALIQLLDDPDQIIFETVEKELLKESCKIIPVLEKKWETSYDEFCQDRIENIIQNLQFKQTKNNLKRWIVSKDQDLLAGFICIDRFQYPDINVFNINKKIERIKKEVWLELSNSLTMLEKTTVLNHFLFNIYGFSVNHSNINSPQNCYLNQLLDTKKGNPVSIAILYTIVARMLDLPARFTDFPKNPLIALVDNKIAKKVHGPYSKTDVLFYINPANKGSITNRSEIDYHLKKNRYTPTDNYAEPASDTIFIKRLIESLRDSYLSVGFPENKDRTEQLLKLFGKITV